MAGIAQGVADYLTLRRNLRTLRGDALASFQRRECRKLVGFAVENSTLYRRLYAGRDLDRFEDLPTVDKAVVTAGFDELNTAGLRRTEVEAFALEMERSGDHLRRRDRSRLDRRPARGVRYAATRRA